MSAPSPYVPATGLPSADWIPPRATGANVLIVPKRTDTEEVEILGDVRTVPVDRDTGLLLGREEELHVGRVVAIGDEARRMAPEVELGSWVVWQRDHGATFDWDGLKVCVLNLRVRCPHCKGELHGDQVLGVL